MAVDKLVDSAQLDADLTSVADAIRTKGGTSAQLAFPADFVSAINAISGGGGIDEIEFAIDSSKWENYGVTSSNGSIGANANRIITSVSPEILSVSVPSGYNVALFAYEMFGGTNYGRLENTYIGGWTGAAWQKSLTWHTSIEIPTVPNNYIFKVIMRNAGEGAISPSAGNNAVFTKYGEVA